MRMCLPSSLLKVHSDLERDWIESESVRLSACLMGVLDCDTGLLTTVVSQILLLRGFVLWLQTPIHLLACLSLLILFSSSFSLSLSLTESSHISFRVTSPSPKNTACFCVLNIFPSEFYTHWRPTSCTTKKLSHKTCFCTPPSGPSFDSWIKPALTPSRLCTCLLIKPVFATTRFLTLAPINS